jgi:hypothetical protein
MLRLTMVADEWNQHKGLVSSVKVILCFFVLRLFDFQPKYG